MAGRLDGELYQAVGRAIHQPPPRTAVHTVRSADILLRPAGRTDGRPGYGQLEAAHLYPDLVGADFHARFAPAPGEEGVRQPAGRVHPGLADREPHSVRTSLSRPGSA